MRHVIIGTGGAGVSAVEAIRKYDQESEILMISNEDLPPYSACLLLYYLADENKRDITFWKGEDFYDRMNVTPLLGNNVKNIQPNDKKVIVGNESIDYDKLLIAAGGHVDLPSMKGLDMNGVFTFKTLTDTDNIHNWLKTQEVKNALVLGGGFIGLDAAEGLKKHDINVTIIETSDRILPCMLDEEMSTIVKSNLREHGVDVRIENEITKISGKKKVESVKLTDKSALDADMIIIATGVKPNLDVIKDSGIKTNSGIIVNEYLETNIPDVYAAGDIAESLDIITGKRGSILLWQNALVQGSIAGYNMAGKKMEYSGSGNQTLIKVFGRPIVSDGIYEGEEIRYIHNNIYKKMFFKDSTIMGYMLINTMQNAGVFHSLMTSKRDISKYKKLLLKDKFNIGMIEIEAAMLQTIF